MDCAYSGDDKGELVIDVAHIETKCKYHRSAGVSYPLKALVPPGICLGLFYAVYPLCLSILYGGLPVPGKLRTRGLREAVSGCAAPDGVTVKISVEEVLPAPVRISKELLEEFFKKTYRAFDAPYRKIFIEITDAGNSCPKSFKQGDRFEFNINKLDELCPAGFAAVFPYFSLLNVSSAVGTASISVHCPDFVGVTYSIEKKDA